MSKTHHRIRAFFIAAFLAALPLGARALEPAGQDYVKRGEPQRVGNHWEEQATCDAPTREGGKLFVRADFGSISVKPGANDRVSCQIRVRVFTKDEAEARRYLRDFSLSLRPQESGLYLRGDFPQQQHGSRSLGADFDLTVPLKYSLDLETKGGSIQVGKLEGDLKATTAGGDIRTSDVRGPVQAETAGGSIQLGNIGSQVEARTAGGSIRVGDVGGPAVLETSGGEVVAGMIQGTLRAETAGGDLVLRGASGPIEARTAGGQINIGETAGNVVAQTAGGSIRLQGARGKVEVKTAGGSIDLLQVRNAVHASTASGSILAQVDADQKTFAASELQTAAGDIRVFLPPSLPVTIDAAIDMAAGHKILTDFPLNIQGNGQIFAPTKLRGEGNLNGGGQVLRVRVLAGNIEIRKLDPRTLEELRARQASFWKQWQEREERRQQKQQESRDNQ
jgi:hypothetical protein